MLGLITTVVVSWICAVVVDVRSGQFRSVKTPSEIAGIERHYAIWTRSGACRVHVGAVAVEESARRQSVPPYPTRAPLDVPVWRAGWPGVGVMSVPGDDGGWTHPTTQDARGWPGLAMSSEYLVYGASDRAGDFVYRARPRGGLVVAVRTTAAGAPDARVLPLRILWPGFLLNAGCYTVAWIALAAAILAAGAARRSRRRRRGVCIRCAFPLGGSPVCTECGAAVGKRGREPFPATVRSQVR
jgi:hypothetical protein